MQAKAKSDAKPSVEAQNTERTFHKKKSVLALPETLSAMAAALKQIQPSRPYRAFIITIGTLKGGAGKTTISVQLAGFLAALGFRVLIVDGDIQGTSTKWVGDAAGNEESALANVSVINLAKLEGKIANEIRKFVNDYDIILVDCPPKLGGVMQSALTVTDLMLIPTRPSLPDIDSAKETLELAQGITIYNTNLKLAFLMTNRRPKTILSKQSDNMLNTIISGKGDHSEEAAEVELGDSTNDSGVVFLNSGTQSREAYAQSIFMGDTIAAFKNQTEAIDEMNALATESMMLLAGVWDKEASVFQEQDEEDAELPSEDSVATTAHKE